MKIKLTNIVPKKLEKKNTNLFILDIYIQREESFNISVINNKFEHHIIYNNNNDKNIIPVFYPRIKNTSFYQKKILKKTSNNSILIKPIDNKNTPEKINEEDDNNLIYASKSEITNSESSLKKIQIKNKEYNNEK